MQQSRRTKKNAFTAAALDEFASACALLNLLLLNRHDTHFQIFPLLGRSSIYSGIRLHVLEYHFVQYYVSKC